MQIEIAEAVGIAARPNLYIVHARPHAKPIGSVGRSKVLSFYFAVFSGRQLQIDSETDLLPRRFGQRHVACGT